MVTDRLSAPARSALGRAYREHLARDGVRPANLARAAEASDSLLGIYRSRLLPTPVFLSYAERAALVRDLDTMYRLLTALPERLYGGDVAALARTVGMNPTQVGLVRRAADGSQLIRLGRADLYRGSGGFKLLELNSTSALGGLDSARINRAMLGHRSLARFVRQHGLGYVDTFHQVARTLRAECAGRCQDRPVVALADWPESFKIYEPRLRVFAAALDEIGIEGVPCHVGQLAERAGRLEVRGRPVDVIFRFFMLEEIVTPEDACLIEPLLRAVESGAVGMISRMDAELYGNKGLLAVLSDNRNHGIFRTEELACIDRLLPWTRLVRATVSEPDGSVHDLDSFARAEQQNLILKPTMLHGGKGIVPGWTVPPEEWLARVHQAADGPYLLQRRVVPDAEVFPGSGDGEREMYLKWGVFMTDPLVTGSDGYGGSVIRGSEDPQIGVVNMRVGAEVGCVFHERFP